MADDVLLSSPDLEAARARRASLRQACIRLERTLAAGDDGSDGGSARDALTSVLDEVATVWARHTATTEAPDGLLAQIVADAPRLASMVARLRREHPEVSARLASAHRQLGAGGGIDEAATEIRALLAAIDRHRRDGGELIYRAYNVDLGSGE